MLENQTRSLTAGGTAEIKNIRNRQVCDIIIIIIIYFLAFLPCVTRPPAAAVGPTGLIFDMRMEFVCGLTLFG